MEDETWRPVFGYEGLYEVSDLGRVRSLITNRILSGGVERKSGRRTVTLTKYGRVRSPRVYVLVLEAFRGPRPIGMAACHNDGDPSNDRLSNLRWDTWSENQRDSIDRHGTNFHARTTHCPRGHELVPDNITPSQIKTGKRACLACSRATSNYRSALRRGLPADFQQLSDAHFQRITSGG